MAFGEAAGPLQEGKGKAILTCGTGEPSRKANHSPEMAGRMIEQARLGWRWVFPELHLQTQETSSETNTGARIHKRDDWRALTPGKSS